MELQTGAYSVACQSCDRIDLFLRCVLSRERTDRQTYRQTDRRLSSTNILLIMIKQHVTVSCK